MIRPDLEKVAAIAVADTAAGRDWQSVEVEFVYLGASLSIAIYARRDDERVLLQNEEAAEDKFMELRDGMADEQGVWLSCRMSLQPSGAYEFDYNWDDRPVWPDGMEVDDESLYADLQDHPRPWSSIPAWHPVKQNYTEESWAAETTRF